MERLRGVPELNVSDFGTRRRHSFLWQEYVVKAMSDVLGENFIGSSNTYLAYTHDLEAIGTNAHELPMAMAALANSDEEMQGGPVPSAGTLAADLPGRTADHAARHFRYHTVSRKCARLGRKLDRPAHRQQRSLHCRRRIHRMAPAAWPRPAQKRLIASDALDVDTILGLARLFWRYTPQRRHAC